MAGRMRRAYTHTPKEQTQKKKDQQGPETITNATLGDNLPPCNMKYEDVDTTATREALSTGQ